MRLTVIQLLPALEVGGVERGTLEIARALVNNGHRSIVISAGGRMVRQLESEGSEHFALPIGKKSVFTLRYTLTLRKIFNETNASIIHARSRLPAWIAWLAWRGMDHYFRPRFITTVHGPYTVNAYSQIMTRGERIIAISEFIRDYILKNYRGLSPDIISVIPRGVAPEQYPYGYKPPDTWLLSWKEQHPQLNGKFIITLPARVTRWKGHEDFIEIVRKAVNLGLPVHALIAGAPHPGKQVFYTELRRQINGLDLGRHITLLGHRDDMREVLSVSDVVFSLAREPEAFGRTALEALALGVPVIAYDHGGAAEVLRDMFPEGRIPPLNTDAAVITLEKFYKTPLRVPDYNPYTLENMTYQTLKLYNSLPSTLHD